MNVGLNDSNTALACGSGWAFSVQNLTLWLGLLCAVLSGAFFSTACFAVEFVEIEFNADFRSPSDAGKVPLRKPDFRSPGKPRSFDTSNLDTGNLNSPKPAVDVQSLPESPLEFRPAAWYADKTKKKAKGKEKTKAEATKWTPKPLGSLGTNIALPGGDIPNGEGADANLNNTYCDYHCNRGWSSLCYCFAATGLYYNPLYFEEVNLERYGYGCQPCLQSAASAAHFFGHVPLLPYMMATDCPSDCIYALGHYRPGSCVPWRRHCLPINKRGGLGQAGAIVALVFLLP